MFAFVSFVAFTAMMTVVSYFLTRDEKLDSTDGYFLGGRSLTGPIICGSLMLTNLSTEHLIGMSGGAYKEGANLMLWETLAAIAMALFFLPLISCRGWYQRGWFGTFCDRTFLTDSRSRELLSSPLRADP